MSCSKIHEKSSTYFECQLVFPRLPNHITHIDLIEGEGMDYHENHWNIFNHPV